MKYENKKIKAWMEYRCVFGNLFDFCSGHISMLTQSTPILVPNRFNSDTIQMITWGRCYYDPLFILLYFLLFVFQVEINNITYSTVWYIIFIFTTKKKGYCMFYALYLGSYMLWEMCLSSHQILSAKITLWHIMSL